MEAKKERQNSQNEDMQQKLEFLQKRYEDAHRYFKFTLTVITLIFLFVGVIVTVLSIASKSDINEAINRMDRRFEVLSGEALKKPEIKLFYDGEPISGRSIDIARNSGEVISLKDFDLKNVGNRTAENIRIKFYFSIPIRQVITLLPDGAGVSGPWEVYKSPDKDLRGLLIYYETVSLNPGEPYSILGFQARIDKEFWDLKRIRGKIVVYFGGERPVESHIDVILKQAGK